MPRLRSRLPSGRLPTLAANLALLLSGVLSSVCISRALAPDGRGEYVTWQAWGAAIAILAVGGLPQALVLDRTTAGRHSIGQLARPLLSTLAVALAAAVGLALALRPPPLVFAAMVLVIIVNQVGAVGPAEAQRAARMGGEFNLARLAPQAAALAAIAVLILVRDDSYRHWLIAISGGQAVVVLLWCARTLRRTVDKSASYLTAKTWMLFPANVATQLQYRFDLIAVAALFPPKTVAFYSVGVASQAAVLAMGQASGMYWFSKSHSTRPGLLRGEIFWAMMMAAAGAVPLAVLSPLWVGAVYGAEFSPAGPIVAVLCLAGVTQSIDYLLVHELLRRGGDRHLLSCRLPGLVTLLIGFGLIWCMSLPPGTLGLAPLAGYAASSMAFLFVLRRPPREGDRAGALERRPALLIGARR